MIFSVVLPVYDEEEAIEITINRLMKTKEEIAIISSGEISDIEIIVVDDGSRDNSVKIASKFKDKIRLIRHTKNKGYGATLKTGFANALGDIIGYLDADCTYPPESFPALIKELLSLNGDMVIGSRMSTGETNMPILRQIGNAFFATIVSWLTGKKMSDIASGMRVFKRSIYDRLDGLPDGFDYTLAFTVTAHQEGFRVLEKPIPYHHRLGKSKLNPLLDGLRFLKTLIQITAKKK